MKLFFNKKKIIDEYHNVCKRNRDIQTVKVICRRVVSRLMASPYLAVVLAGVGHAELPSLRAARQRPVVQDVAVQVNQLIDRYIDI